ncbi:MAG: pyridoxine 5'-phosphate synthase [Elusimicrobia bacterium]|nr:pyridoxine 5'-phosphate synthase [Elusimicrobiota bacterium]
MVKLGIGLDHYAAMRLVPGAVSLELPAIVQMAVRKGAKAVTLRWFQGSGVVSEKDLVELRRLPKVALHVRVGVHLDEAVSVIKASPHSICLVPGSAAEISAEGGLNLEKPEIQKNAGKVIEAGRKKGLEVSALCDPRANVIRAAKKLGVTAIDLCARSYARATNKGRRDQALENLSVAGLLAGELNIKFRIGTGLHAANIGPVAQISDAEYVYCGSALAARSLEMGLPAAVEELIEMMASGVADPLALEI